MKITTLEKRIDVLEQYFRMDNVLVSGLNVNHTSYLRAVVQSNLVEIIENCPIAVISSRIEQAVSFLASSICHTVKIKTSRPQIVIKFYSRKAGNCVLSQAENLKGTNFIIDKHLTHKNANLLVLPGNTNKGVPHRCHHLSLV